MAEGLGKYETAGDDLVGRLLIKEFDGRPYLGQVVGFVPAARTTWAVVYNDGDREELFRNELEAAVARAAGGSAATAKQQQQLSRQVELWNNKRQADVKLEQARDRNTRSQVLGRYAEKNMARPKPAIDSHNARRQGRKKKQIIDDEDDEDEDEDVEEEEEDDDDEWTGDESGDGYMEDEGQNDTRSRRGLSASKRAVRMKKSVRSYAELDSESDDMDDESNEEEDLKVSATKENRAEAQDGKAGRTQARRGVSSRTGRQDNTLDKADEVIERVVRENEEKVKKLDQLRKSGQV